MEKATSKVRSNDELLLGGRHVQLIVGIVLVTAMSAISLFGYAKLKTALERSQQSTMQLLVHDRVQTLRTALLESNKQVSDALLLSPARDFADAAAAQRENANPPRPGTILKNTLGLDSFALNSSGALVASDLSETSGIDPAQVPSIVAHCQSAGTPLTYVHAYCLAADQEFVFHTFPLGAGHDSATLILPESTSAIHTLFQQLPPGIDSGRLYLAVHGQHGVTLALGPGQNPTGLPEAELTSLLDAEKQSGGGSPGLSGRSTKSGERFAIARQRVGYGPWEVAYFVNQDVVADSLRAYLVTVLSLSLLAAYIGSRLLLSLFRVVS